jgi:hypothetical protein
VLSHPELPGLRDYYVLSVGEDGSASTPDEIYELSVLAQRLGRDLAREQHGDPECYSIIYNAGRTRRMPWPHFHILMARSMQEKRRVFFLLHLKHLLRWRKWPLVRWLARET